MRPLRPSNADSDESSATRGAATRSRIVGALEALIDRYRPFREGRVADYIPELAKADPDWFAISIVTVDGVAYEVGDHAREYTIQSMSKPFCYGLALEDCGRAAVLDRVGVEPSGDPFNSIIRLDATNRPHNPMVNAGAIATTAMIAGTSPTHRLARMLDMFGQCMGRRPNIDMAVYTSERTTGHRNRAMAHLMLNFGVIDGPVEEALDLYFQQCSVLVSTHDMASMAATLANQGVNPVTGERAFSETHTRDILTVMHTCGMYNYAGQWAYTVGLPAKSGVSGGVIACVPGQFGICVFSPPVDARGNSTRGIRVCEDLSRDAGMHIFEAWPAEGSLLDRIDRVSNPLPSFPESVTRGVESDHGRLPAFHTPQPDPQQATRPASQR